MPEIISREEARERGLKRYFTGKPCLHGHVSERYTQTCLCYQCSLEHNREQYRKDQALDPEKRRKYARDYYMANREKLLKRAQKLNAEASASGSNEGHNKDKLRAKWRRYYERSCAEGRHRKWTDNAKRSERARRRKISDLLAVLRTEMPELLKEFGL